MRRFLCFAFLFAWALCSNAEPVTKRYPSDIQGIDLVLSYDNAPVTTDYEAESRSSLPPTDPYVIVRGLDQGLVRLVNEHGRQARRYTVPRDQVRAILRIKHDVEVLDRVDLVFTRTNLVLIHTTTANAGMFTVSDVYELPFIARHDVDRRLLTGKPALLKILDIGLAFDKEKP